MSPKAMSGREADPAPYWRDACQVLSDADPVLGALIEAAQGSVLRPRNDPFFSLARSVVGQQISVMAAESVWRKLVAQCAAITPQGFAEQSAEDLRACGLSRQKVTYMHGLAAHFLDGGVNADAWPDMDDEAIIKQLTTVKGIGRWTAEMFLIFHLLRPDVMPVGDIGIQKAIGNHYAGGTRPGPKEMIAIAEKWRPWRSVAVWDLWRSLDAVPVEY